MQTISFSHTIILPYQTKKLEVVHFPALKIQVIVLSGKETSKNASGKLGMDRVKNATGSNHKNYIKNKQ